MSFLNFLKTKIFWAQVGLAVAATIVLLVLVNWGLDIYTTSGRTVVVPTLVGHMQSEVEDEVRMLAAYLIMIHAAMMPFNSFLHNCYFTLRSGGQSLITFLFDSAFVWAVSVPVAKLLAFGTDLPIIPLVALCVSLDLIKCVIGFILLKSGKWARKLV